jgi:hypothetical protein
VVEWEIEIEILCWDRDQQERKISGQVIDLTGAQCPPRRMKTGSRRDDQVAFWT